MPRYVVAYRVEALDGGSPPPAPPLTVLTSSLPNGQVGVIYGPVTLQVTGGTAPYTWTTVEPLPAGLSLNPSTGVISGTPTTAGNYTPRVQVTDADLDTAESGSLPMVVVAAGTVLTVTTSALPNGQINVAYGPATLQAVGGTLPYTWSISSGALPAGLTLNPFTGVISGTPTSAGVSSFVVRVTDAVSAVDDSGSYNVTIAGLSPVNIQTTFLGNGSVGTAYSRTLSVTGGNGSYTMTLSGGSLPSGLSISGLTISGTPTTEQTRTFSLRVQDGTGLFDEQDYTITIVAAGTLEGPMDYFNALAALPEAVAFSAGTTTIDPKGCSLRNQTQLDRACKTSKPTTPRWWTYDPDSDTAPDKQDAAKLDWPRNRIWHSATAINGFINVTGTPGAVVPLGTLLTRLETGYKYRVEGNYTLDATGFRLIRVAAITPVGALYLAEAYSNAVLTFDSPPSGVNASAVVPTKIGDWIKCRENESIPGVDQLWFPFPVSDGSIVYTWDTYMSAGWRTDHGTASALKIYMVITSANGGSATSSGSRWWTLRWNFNKQTSDPATMGWDDHPFDGSHVEGHTQPSSDHKYTTPTGLGAVPARSWQYHHSKWIRQWVEIKPRQSPSAFTEWNTLVCRPGELNNPCTGGTNGDQIKPNPDNPAGEYHMASLWYADETRDPVALIYRRPFRTDVQVWPFITGLLFEYNASPLAPAHTADLYTYVRGVHALRNYPIPDNWATDTFLFKRPVRG